jgi:hypothetical protein
VQRAFDRAGLDEALREQRELVRAHVVEGVNFSVEAIERDREVAEIDGERRILGDLRKRSDAQPGVPHQVAIYSAALACSAACSSP